MGKKKKRLEATLQKKISEIVQQDLNDPRLGFITVTSVELSNDFKFGKVLFSALGASGKEETEGKIKLYEEVLNHSSATIQKIIASDMQLRFTPKLTFRYTDRLRKGFEISSLIDRARATDLDHVHDDDESDTKE